MDKRTFACNVGENNDDDDYVVDVDADVVVDAVVAVVVVVDAVAVVAVPAAQKDLNF